MPTTPNRAEIAYEKLRQLIVEGRLPPGMPLIERQLATRLQVSRTPLRVAIERLHHEGYVVVSSIEQYKRATVAPLTAEDGRELFVLIGALEGCMARHVANLPAIKRKQLVHELRALNIALRNAARARPPDPTRLNEIDVAFHGCYAALANGRRLTSLYAAVKPQAARYELAYTTALLGNIQVSADEHDAIIEAFESGDAGDAQSAVEANWRQAAERLAQVIRSRGEKGVW